MQQMRVDEHAQHAERLVVFDESHPAHVGGEIVDRSPLRRRPGRKPLSPANRAAYSRRREKLVPFVETASHRPQRTSAPWRNKSATRCPPMKPPAPQTTNFLGRHVFDKGAFKLPRAFLLASIFAILGIERQHESQITDYSPDNASRDGAAPGSGEKTTPGRYAASSAVPAAHGRSEDRMPRRRR